MSQLRAVAIRDGDIYRVSDDQRTTRWPKVGYSSSWLMLGPFTEGKVPPEKEMPELQREARTLTPLALGCVKDLFTGQRRGKVWLRRNKVLIKPKGSITIA